MDSKGLTLDWLAVTNGARFSIAAEPITSRAHGFPLGARHNAKVEEFKRSGNVRFFSSFQNPKADLETSLQPPNWPWARQQHSCPAPVAGPTNPPGSFMAAWLKFIGRPKTCRPWYAQVNDFRTHSDALQLSQ
jgi:hypothetical protein